MAGFAGATGPHHGAESGANAGADAGHGGASRTHCFADTVSAPRGGAALAHRGAAGGRGGWRSSRRPREPYGESRQLALRSQNSTLRR